VGSFFQVDMEVLQHFVTSLEASGDHMESALNALQAVEGGQIGTGALNDAANDFQDTWRYGLGQLKDKIKDTNDGIKAAHGAYQEVDQSTAQMLEKFAQTVTGGQ
jgi:uncharacterized protein YukE